MMTKASLSVASLLLLALTTSFIAPAAAKNAHAAAAREGYPAAGVVSREVPAPPWSFACTNDQGPSECGEPMWIYGSPARDAR